MLMLSNEKSTMWHRLSVLAWAHAPSSVQLYDAESLFFLQLRTQIVLRRQLNFRVLPETIYGFIESNASLELFNFCHLKCLPNGDPDLWTPKFLLILNLIVIPRILTGCAKLTSSCTRILTGCECKKLADFPDSDRFRTRHDFRTDANAAKVQFYGVELV